MATEIIPAPNVVRFLRPRVRRPALADALVNISRVRATLAPLDQANAIARFDTEQLRALICGAVSTLHEALLDLRGEARP
jgi:hypothetical protein